MKNTILTSGIRIKVLLLFFVSFLGNAQEMEVNLLGGAQVNQSDNISITAGSSLTFRIINTRSDCGTLKIEDIILSNTTDFSVSHYSLSYNIRSVNCKNGTKYLDFTVRNISGNCAASTNITIENNRDPNFTFSVSINSSPQIYVLGGSPLADINNGSTVTSATNGTYFGVVDEGSTVTRRFAIANIGSCGLDITSAISSNPDFTITSPYSIPFSNLASYYYIVIDVAFKAPAAGVGTQTSTISIGSNDTSTGVFVFNVTAEMFKFNIPGPGGVTADFRLWLKSTRGIKYEPSTTDKVRCWLDLGSNGKNAEQLTAANQPTFLDDLASNINFNPVIKFENNGTTLNQYLANSSNGYYSQEIFVVMEPDVDVATSTGMTIFSGTVAVNSYLNTYVDNVNDVSGVGLGNFTSRISSPEEKLWYNQGNSVSDPYYTLLGANSRSYNSAAIINARNKSNTPSDGMTLLYNSYNDAETPTKSSGFTSENLGYIDTAPDPDVVWGTPYKIGTNANATFGNLNGRVAEIFTFAERLNDADRNKIESYLAIKYGITLGLSTETQKNFVNSFGTAVWDITSNAGYNFNVAGIGRDDNSDLNQKQSKTINTVNDVTIGLGNIYTTNSENSNEFKNNGDFLVWGCDNGAYTSGTSNTVTIATGITTTVTKIARKWKIIESTQVTSDVENVYVGIPETAFSLFSKSSSEEYVLVVADNANFANTDIIDVIPLRIKVDASGTPILDKNGSQLYQTWYDFDGTKYFTFGKASKLESGKRSANIGSGDFLVGENSLNLNVDSFTISAWVRRSGSETTDRTLIAKGEKLQLKLNSTHNIEVLIDDLTPKFTSTMALTDNKWHQITFVYDSGTIYLYVDGVLDKSEQNVVHPSPNYNRFSVGVVYIDKNNIINPFLGEIDEVYVWDLGLKEDQVRYLMNQEVEKVTGNLVNGKAIPKTIIDNEAIVIPWSNLRAYYDFNSFYGSTVEGLTNERYFLRLNYLNKSKSIIKTQTAPLPYVTIADGDWSSATTWANSTTQNLPNSIGLDGVTKIDWNIIEINNAIFSTSEISALSLKINSNKFTVNADNSIKITHYLLLNGVLDLEGESQLIQTMDSDFDTASTGYIERDQQGVGNRFRYNDWSSPVYSGTNVNGNFATVAGVLKDGTDANAPVSLNFTSAVNGSTSPLTLSTYWMYKYANSPGNSYSSWQKVAETGEIYAGEGFLMKGSSDPGASDQNYVFEGKPNNGTIELMVGANYEYLVGNPYPSALDAEQFIFDNANSITGTLYFWEHYGGNSHNLKDYQAGYGLYSLGGGTPAAAHASVSNLGSSTKTPKNFIAVGQGFFVVGDADGGQIQFNNDQRVFQTEDITNSVFMKGTVKATESKDKRPKFRVGFNAPNIDHRQLLLTIDERATKSADWGFDAEVYDLLEDDMFWVINDKKYGIQCINNIDFNSEIPLGIKTKDGGLLTIKIDSLENVDSTIEIYIKDNVTNIETQINSKSFEIDLPAGEYLNRFSMVFKTNQKEIENVTILEEETTLPNSISIFMNNESSELHISKNENYEILEIKLINYLGQVVEILNGNFKENSFSIPVSNPAGLYFVQINSNEGFFNKKILIN